MNATKITNSSEFQEQIYIDKNVDAMVKLSQEFYEAIENAGVISDYTNLDPNYVIERESTILLLRIGLKKLKDIADKSKANIEEKI
tara:strand:- start:97 stop:354 length:258 start_codon:yes stop_codon:yes gene_type:complete